MKKIIPLLISGIIICTAFSKQTKYLSDYRDAYIGKYFCKCYCRSTIASQNNNNTPIDTLTVNIYKDIMDSTLQINIKNNNIKVRLSNNKILPNDPSVHFSGKFFASDSIAFIKYVGLGGICSYRGKKK